MRILRIKKEKKLRFSKVWGWAFGRVWALGQQTTVYMAEFFNCLGDLTIELALAEHLVVYLAHP